MAPEVLDKPLTANDIESALEADDIQDKSSKSDFDFSILGDDKDDEEIIPDREVKTAEDDEEKEDEEKEESEEESELKLSEDEDELELAKIPKRQEIKKAFPDLFKKFPALEHALYREQQYAEVFPSIKDAKEAKESIEQFNAFQGELLSGNVENVLRAVKNTNSKAFDKIANSLLDSLVRIDPNAHLGITRQVSKGVLNYIHNAATAILKKNPDDKRAQQMQIAAELIHDNLFDSPEVTPDRPVKEEQIDPEREKLTAERAKFEESRFVAAFNTISSSINTLLTNTVTKEIDVKNILPPYVKSTLVKDVMSELDRQLVGDQRFKQLVDKLWLKAKEQGYSDQSMNNIKTALKEKAKTILPGIMRAKKGEAMKGLTSQPARDKRELVRSDKEETRPSSEKKKITLSRRDDDRSRPRDGESNLDFLMRD